MANTKFNAYTAVKLQCDFDYGLPRHLQRTRSAKFPAPLATSTECEVPRANGRTVAAGSVADFLRALYFLGNTISYIVVIVNSCFIRNS